MIKTNQLAIYETPEGNIEVIVGPMVGDMVKIMWNERDVKTGNVSGKECIVHVSQLKPTITFSSVKFRNRPVVIDAVQFKTNNELGDINMNSIVDWVNTNCGKAHHDSTDIYIETTEGAMRAEVGDWIIKGVNGEFYRLTRR